MEETATPLKLSDPLSRKKKPDIAEDGTIYFTIT